MVAKAKKAKKKRNRLLSNKDLLPCVEWKCKKCKCVQLEFLKFDRDGEAVIREDTKIKCQLCDTVHRVKI